ncbi:MAG: glutamate--tRNA ligase [Gammaproteobacteria bacterium]
MIKTRFAPSPTGLMHLGNVRTALFNHCLACREKGVFLLRIEDTDAARDTEESVAAIVEDLRWLGLAWDEGYPIGGPAGPYRQSERGVVYADYYRTLEAEGHAYPCFCTAEELAMTRNAQLTAGTAPRYPGTCARLDADRIEAKRRAGNPATLRFRVPQGKVSFDDLVRGPQSFAALDIGDFVIRRSDGSPAFFFSNALDDALMAVTHVLRGEDHLSNTPRQLLLLTALGLPAPRYGHIALVLGEGGTPLGKRQGSRSVRALRDQGYLPLALDNTLARLGHTYEDPGFRDLDGLAAGFSLDHLGRAPARFDASQLDHWQRETIARSTPAELWGWMSTAVGERVPEAMRPAFVEAIRANVLLPADALLWAGILYGDGIEISDAAARVLAGAASGFFDEALKICGRLRDFSGLAGALKGRLGVSGKALFLPLRAALTGRIDGPDLADLIALMRRERIRERFAALIKKP